MSDHFIRLGMSNDMKAKIEEWRSKQLAETGSIPSFSEAVRQLVEKGFDSEK